MQTDRCGSRVVVTGIGVASSLGLCIADLWHAIENGKSGIGFIAQFDSRALPVKIGGEIDLAAFPPEPDERLRANRVFRFATWAAEQAWFDAGFKPGHHGGAEAGLCLGSGGFPEVEKRYAEIAMTTDATRLHSTAWLLQSFRKHPELFLQYSPSAVSDTVSRRLGLQGPSLNVQSACTSGTQAIGHAFRMVQAGRVKRMVCGGADSMLSAFCVAGFTLLGALSVCDEPQRASRPFALDRDGFVLGEGAAIVVLESLEAAESRGARIYAEVAGYGTSGDGYRFTDMDPDAQGAAAAMQNALTDAGIAPEHVGYINAHGTATPQNDRIETLAIKKVFGDHARKLAISSTKSHLGHLICAAGAIEFVLTVAALDRRILPATINLHQRDPECDLDFIPLEARAMRIQFALSNSFGFGGQNGSIAVRAWA